MSYHSFAELGAVMGIKAPEKQDVKNRKCRRCGGEMHHIEGTNVFICEKDSEHRIFSDVV